MSSDGSAIDNGFKDQTRRRYDTESPHDTEFIQHTEDRLVEHQYLRDAIPLQRGNEVQATLAGITWDTRDEAVVALEKIIDELNKQVRRSEIMSQFVTLWSSSMVLPDVDVHNNSEILTTRPRIIHDEEFVPELHSGATGRFHSFYYDIQDNEQTSDVHAHLIYRVALGMEDSKYSQALLFASAVVGPTTVLEFLQDRDYQLLLDAGDVFDETGDETVYECISELHGITFNNTGDYSIEELGRISEIIQILTTHESLSGVRKKVQTSLETILSHHMSPRLGKQPLSLTHTAGLRHRTDDITTTDLVPYWQQPDTPAFYIEPTAIDEVVVMPLYSQSGVDMSDMNGALEPYIVVRQKTETHYVPLSQITAVA